MEIWLDSTPTKRIDLCFDYKVNEGSIKERMFVVRFGNSQRSFEHLLDAVKFYQELK